MRLSIVKQIIKDTDMMLITFGVIHSQPYNPWMVKEFVRLSQKLFLMCAVKAIDINVSYILLNGMIKNQQIRSSFIVTQTPPPHPFINRGGISIYSNYFLFFSFPCMLSFTLYIFYMLYLAVPSNLHSSTSNLNNPL